MRNVRAIAGPDAKKYLIPIAVFVLDGFANGGMYCVMLLVLVELAQGTFTVDVLEAYTAVIAACFLARCALQSAGLTLIQRFGPATSCRLRLELGDHIRSINLGFFNKNSIGRLNAILTTDIGDFETVVTHCIGNLVKTVMLTVVGLGLSIAIDGRLGLLFAALVIAALPLLAAAGRASAASALRTRAVKHEASSRIVEYLNGMKTFRLYNLTGMRFSQLDDALAALRDVSYRAEIGVLPLSLSFSALVYLLVPFALVAGSLLLDAGTLGAVSFLLVVMLGVSLGSALVTFSTLYPQVKWLNRAAQSILAVRAESPLAFEENAFAPDRYDIEFRDARFSYAQGEEAVRGVSFAVPAGTSCALIGPSGSGKSTLAALVSRFWDVDEGCVLVGGRDVRDVSPDALNARIATVFQDVYLLADTIEANILVGCPGAMHEDVVASARAARCHDFIEALPDGYATLVGEGGSTLSGGEKQRISIARALLKDAPIVVLDEFTSSLDADNEHEIERALDALMKGKTVIAIAHRLSTVAGADQIVVIDQGGIRERGGHAELLAQDGWYARMYGEQREAEHWRIGLDMQANTEA